MLFILDPIVRIPKHIGVCQTYWQRVGANAPTLFVEMEDTLHHLPLLVAGGVGVALLELRHILLPLRLPWEGGETRHGIVPTEVLRRVDHHDEARAADVDLHLEDAHLAYALYDLLPCLLTAMCASVSCDELRLILQVHGLYVTFRLLFHV